MKALHLMPLFGAVLVGLGVTLLSQPTSVLLGIGLFMATTVIALGLSGTVWLLVVCFFSEVEHE